MRPVIVRLPAALTFIQEPIRAQRRASNTGVIMVAGQRFALGWVHKYQIVTVLVSQTTLAIGLDDQRPVSYAVLPLSPVRSIKGQRLRNAQQFPRPSVKHQVTRIRQESG